MLGGRGMPLAPRAVEDESSISRRSTFSEIESRARQTDRPVSLSVARSWLTLIDRSACHVAISSARRLRRWGLHWYPGAAAARDRVQQPAGAAAPPTPTNSAPSVAPSEPIEINVRVPALLVFPGPERIPGLVQVTAAQRDTGQATVTFHDSRGRAVTYDAAASFAEGIRRRGKATRENVAPKVLAAYILDSTWQTLRSERAARAFPAWQTAHSEPPELLREFETDCATAARLRPSPGATGSRQRLGGCGDRVPRVDRAAR